MSIHVGRLESLCRFGAALSNRSVDSGRLPRIVLSIRVGRLESLCRLGSAGANRFVVSGRSTRIVISILAGRLESLFRFGSADPATQPPSHPATQLGLLAWVVSNQLKGRVDGRYVFVNQNFSSFSAIAPYGWSLLQMIWRIHFCLCPT